MLKRLGMILATSTALLVGCDEEKDWSVVKGAEVVKIDSVERCTRGCWAETTVTFKKDDIEFKLEESYTANVELLSVGQVLDVYYDEDYYLKKYELPFKKDEQK